MDWKALVRFCVRIPSNESSGIIGQARSSLSRTDLVGLNNLN